MYILASEFGAFLCVVASGNTDLRVDAWPDPAFVSLTQIPHICCAN